MSMTTLRHIVATSEQVLFIGALPMPAIAHHEAVQGVPADIVHRYADYVSRVVWKKH